MALNLGPWEVFFMALILVVAILLVAYGVAGHYERRARRRRERRMRG